MKEEIQNRIKELQADIRELNVRAFEKRQEIERIYVDENLNFENSYVEYFDGEDGSFVFMNVDRCIVSEEGTDATLYGTVIKMDDNPLSMEDCDAEITWGEYIENERITINSQVLSGTGYSTIRKISKNDFSFVFDYWCRSMKETLFGKG